MSLRHSVATHLLKSGSNIRVVQKLMEHTDVKTTEHMCHRKTGHSHQPLERSDCGDDLLNTLNSRGHVIV